MGIFGRRKQGGPAGATAPPRTSPGIPAQAPPRAPSGTPPTDDGNGGDGSRWIYEIGGDYSSETWSPPEAIRRWWRVDRNGDVVEGPVENENYGPPQDDLHRVTDPDGPLRWLPDPEKTVRGWLSVALGRLSDGIDVHWLKVTGAPLVLAGHDASRASVPDFLGTPPPRIGAAVPVGVGVQLAGHAPKVLWGLLVWVTVSDASGERQNVWLRHEIGPEEADATLRLVLADPETRF